MIQVGVLVLVLNDKDQILLGKRVDNNLLSLPGGKIEYGESFEQCAKREVKEECGLDLKTENLSQIGAVNVTRQTFHSILIMNRYFITEEECLQIQNLEPHKCYGWDFYDLHSLTSENMQIQLGHAIKEFIYKYYQNNTQNLLQHCKNI